MTRGLAMLFAIGVLMAADFTGNWKLNTSKSKYEGTPAPKELTVTYTPKGNGWDYTAEGTAANGSPMLSSFTYVKDGEEIKTTGFPNWDTVTIKGGAADKGTIYFKRQGKSVGSATRTLSADGKTMTISAKVTTPEGKKVSYVSVYEKQ